MKTERLIIGSAQVQRRYGITTKLKLNQKRFQDLLDKAIDYQIEWVDTARSYGTAESWISQSGIKSFNIATKISILARDRESLLNDLSFSQDKLGRNQIKVVFAHDWEESNFIERERFLSLKEDKPEIKFGASLYEVSSLVEILSGLHSPSIVQIPVSVLNQSFVPLLKKCKSLGVELWARSIFLQGAINYHSPKNPFRNHPDILNLADFCKKLNVTPFQVALSFASSLSVDKIIIGFESSRQLIEIAELCRESPEFKDLDRLASIDQNLIDPRRWR
jgi:aryl-alcohol dehydrogenase-like predicted oxidoreductase